jgi:hypothetical protein
MTEVFKWVQGQDLNLGPSGYEPDELVLLDNDLRNFRPNVGRFVGISGLILGRIVHCCSSLFIGVRRCIEIIKMPSTQVRSAPSHN